MGLLYSLASYVYPTSGSKLTEGRIRTRAQRLIIQVKNQQYKLQQEAMREEGALIKQMGQMAATRSREGEQAHMKQVLALSERRLVLDELVYSLNKIVGEAETLATEPSKASNDCIIAVSSVIYCEELLKEMVDLSEFIPEPRPMIGKQHISPRLQKYIDTKPPSAYDLNLYALEMIDRHPPLTLDTLNKPGHKFVAEPMKPIEPTPSEQMWAVTLEEIPIEEEEEKGEGGDGAGEKVEE